MSLNRTKNELSSADTNVVFPLIYPMIYPIDFNSKFNENIDLVLHLILCSNTFTQISLLLFVYIFSTSTFRRRNQRPHFIAGSPLHLICGLF